MNKTQRECVIDQLKGLDSKRIQDVLEGMDPKHKSIIMNIMIDNAIPGDNDTSPSILDVASEENIPGFTSDLFFGDDDYKIRPEEDILRPHMSFSPQDDRNPFGIPEDLSPILNSPGLSQPMRFSSKAICSGLTNVKSLIDIMDPNANNPGVLNISDIHKFDVESTQGYVGSGKVAEDEYSPQIDFVYKISQEMNFLVEHEALIANGLNSIRNFCPHFAYGVTTLNILRRGMEKFTEMPVRPEERNLDQKILITQYIKNSQMLEDYIDSIDDDEMNQYNPGGYHKDRSLFSISAQVIAGLLFAQEDQHFTHYDLHLKNVMAQPIEPNGANLYIFKGNAYFVPTLGINPVVIDYGYCYSDNLMNKPFFSTVNFANLGYLPYMPNSIIDARFLLAIARDEVENSFLRTFDCQGFSAYMGSGWENHELVAPHDIGDYFTESLMETQYSYISNSGDIAEQISYRNASIFNEIGGMLGALAIIPFKKREKVSSETFGDTGKHIINFVRQYIHAESDNTLSYCIQRIVEMYNNMLPDGTKGNTPTDSEMSVHLVNLKTSISNDENQEVDFNTFDAGKENSKLSKNVAKRLINLLKDFGKYASQFFWEVMEEKKAYWKTKNDGGLNFPHEGERYDRCYYPEEGEPMINPEYNSMEKLLQRFIENTPMSKTELDSLHEITVYDFDKKHSHTFKIGERDEIAPWTEDSQYGISSSVYQEKYRTGEYANRLKDIYKRKLKNNDLDVCVRI